MKVISLFILTLGLGISPLSAQETTPTKHALIVAIGNYPESGGWGKISGHRDVPYVEQSLNRQHFLAENITTLIDSQATRKNIEYQLNELIHKVNKGDVVVIHFSSHGEQIEDDNGDEADGLDEAIVAYDAISPKKSMDFSKDTFGYLRDDVFGNYVNQLRKKLGPKGDLVVCMDACHSGSGTRGALKSRGGEKPLVSPNYKPKTGSADKGVFKETIGTDEGMATYVVFSAARAEELAFEVLGENNQSMGSLSFALSKAFEQMEGDISYRAFFSKIQGIMLSKVPGQHPVMEGNGIDRTLFGGNYVHQKNYAAVKKVRTDNSLELDAGIFAGLNKNAVLVLCKAGSASPTIENAVDTATIVSASAYASVAKPKHKLKFGSMDLWAFVIEPVYLLDSIVLEIPASSVLRNGYSNTEKNKIETVLSEMKLVKYKGIPQLSIHKGKSQDSLIVPSNGCLFATVPYGTNYETLLKQCINQFAQYQFLQSLTLSDSSAFLKIELIPFVNNKIVQDSVNSHIVNGNRFYKEGDEFVISATNPTKSPLYLNVIELQPDGLMNAVMPNREAGVYASELVIEPGQTRIFNNYIISIGPPYGSNVYKVFVSRKQIDLENIVAPRTKGAPRGNFGVLENLVQTTVDIGTRGDNLSVKTANANGSVSDLIFEIVPSSQP